MAQSFNALVEDGTFKEGAVMFTQFLRPYGVKRKQWMSNPKEVPAEVWAETVVKFQQLVLSGYRCEMEMQHNGMVSLTIAGYNEDVGEDSDIVTKAMANDEGIPSQVVGLLTQGCLQIAQWGLLQPHPHATDGEK